MFYFGVLLSFTQKKETKIEVVFNLDGFRMTFTLKETSFRFRDGGAAMAAR